MKRTILSILILLVSQAHGQNILNPSFDSVYFGGIDRIFHWVTSDGFMMQSGVTGDTVLPLQPDSNYSAQGFLFSEILWFGNRIDTSPYSLAAMQIANRPRFKKVNGDPYPGFVINGDHLVTDSLGYPDLSRCGIPFSYRPTKLKGYYWFVDSTLLLNNFGRCVILLKKWNPQKGHSDTIAFTDSSIPFNPRMGPEPFEIPIPYVSNQTPDTIMVAFFGGVHPQQPSTFWLDELSFDYSPMGMKEESDQKLKLYPNPASDKVIIEVGSTSIGNLQIIGTLGQIVHQEKFLEAVIELDLTGFSPGIYFVRIQIAGRHFAQPLVIQ